ncbi:MAG: aminotransferase class I/II-fold pyridoxal phosphate-dependent enzyme [Planctomycetes bacterium]|nr:aminotransferase class I/II-fold pyridoxal phosphate-dependent enzyme [Planctomycetota bacterium]
MHLVDLRSDTVTRPTAAMWDAMRRAPLGDDVLGDEPTVTELERRLAAMLAKEAALFVPSGTMANQLAIRCHCESGDEIVAHRDSHIIHYETGAPAALSGCMIHPLDGESGLFTPEAVLASRRSRATYAPRPSLLVVENTHNRGGGTIWSLERFHAVAHAARSLEMRVHVDGARLWNACVAAGYAPAEFARHADTVSVCFSKGLGCPVGSALAGPADVIDRARRFRKMFGGGMRQSGLLAAAALHALDHHVDRIAEDHRHAIRLATGASTCRGISLAIAPDHTPTNMVFLHIDPTICTAQELSDRIARQGVHALALDPQRLRLVTHLDITTAGIDHAVEAIRSALG